MNELTALIKEIGPEMWAALLRQQYIEGVIITVVTSVIILVIVALTLFIHGDLSEGEKGTAFLIVGFVGIGSTMLLLYGITMLINPAYFALMELKP